MSGIEIFRTGRHTAVDGRIIEFGQSHLAEIAGGYDPATHEAPLVVGHPKTNGPAYGWVAGLKVEGDRLIADPSQVDPSFAELVAAGRYKKISASFYPPDHPANPKPGAFYLRHVGFLGAQPPAVKGLRDAAFAEDPQAVEFADWNALGIAAAFRRIREFLIGQFGQDKADQVLPSDMIDDMTINAATSDPDPTPDPVPSYSETQMTEKVPGAGTPAAPTPDELAAREERLKKLELEFAENKAKDTARRAKDRRGEIASFVDGLIGQAKVRKVEREGLIAFMETIPETDAKGDQVEISFSEVGGAEVKESPTAFLRRMLQNRPTLVELREFAPHVDAATVDFADTLSVGKAVDAYIAKAKSEGRDVSPAEAASAVMASQPR